MDRMALLLTLLYFVSTIWIFSYILSFLGLPLFEKEKALQRSAFSLITHVTQKVIRPSPLAPLPKRERD
jgi:hypothetical protein